MPLQDGWSVLAALKADPDLRDIPVVVMTVLKDRGTAMTLGATDFMTKPVDRAALLAILHQHCRSGEHGPVLLVDDDKTARDATRRMLKKLGVAVAEAGNGKEALRWLQHNAPPALILLDLMMPEMDGFGFLDAVQGHPEIALCANCRSHRQGSERGGKAASVGPHGAGSRQGGDLQHRPYRSHTPLLAAVNGGDEPLDPGLMAGNIAHGDVMTKILLVEDNEMNRDMLSRRLVRKGYEVVMALDGQQAVDAVKSQAPDLILMDMSLPVIDGWEVTRRIKAAPDTQAIPVIALTAHAMASDREKSLQAGCDDYDTKPIDFPRLLEKIAALLNRGA